MHLLSTSPSIIGMQATAKHVGLFTRVGLVRTSDNKHRPHGAKLNIKQWIELVCAVALSNLASSAPCHNATLFDLYFGLSTSSLFKPTTTAAVGGIASWVASTAALPFPRGHTRIELGQQRCADRKKSKPNRIEIELLIEKSNRNR